MQKILVTTDLSENSVAGLRFAIQLASQRELELHFLHVNDLWDNSVFRSPSQLVSLENERKAVQRELETLVESTYQSMRIIPGRHYCVFYFHFGVISSILNYATQNKCEYLCISTHGAGKVLKLLGSNTRDLIRESHIPVLCIPKTYQPQTIGNILYASDMRDYEEELKLVIDFCTPLNSNINILNICFPGMPAIDEMEIEKHLETRFKKKISVIHEENSSNCSLADCIDKAVLKLSPSILVMFTNQKRNFLELLFSPSQSENYSFRTTLPLLVYTKNN